MQARHQKCCYIKLWIIIKILRVFNIIWILFYCGLYTMTIDIVTRRIIRKLCIWSLHLRNFLWLPIIALFLQKLRWLSHNYSNFIYIFLKLKWVTEKCICLKCFFHNGLPTRQQHMNTTVMPPDANIRCQKLFILALPPPPQKYAHFKKFHKIYSFKKKKDNWAYLYIY